MSSGLHRYQHWKGTSTGIWRRRATIVRSGIRLCSKSRLLRVVFSLAWCTALAMAGLYFLVGQLMAPDSPLLATLIADFAPRNRALIDGIAAWLLLYPDIAVDGVVRGVFSVTSTLYITFCFFAVALFVPKLISHDLSSNAIIIYNSKALSRADYLIGKFGIVFTMLSLLYVAPITASWVVGNVMSPDLSFFLHSLPAFLRAFGMGLFTVTAVSLLALAVSSLAKKSGAATALWIVLWVISGILANAVSAVFPWGRFLSPQICLREIATHVFDLAGVMTKAGDMLPFFSSFEQMLPRNARASLNAVPLDSVWIPTAFIGAYGLAALVILIQRVRT